MTSLIRIHMYLNTIPKIAIILNYRIQPDAL